jgi:hypothetical protein
MSSQAQNRRKEEAKKPKAGLGTGLVGNPDSASERIRRSTHLHRKNVGPWWLLLGVLHEEAWVVVEADLLSSG